jgi:hypothetical protein
MEFLRANSGEVVLWLSFADQPKGPRPAPKPDPKAAAKAPGASTKPVDPNAVAEEEEEDHEPSEVAAVLSDLAPWAISILVHGALVILAIFIVWITIPKVTDEEPIIPMARLSKNPGAPLSMKTTQKLSKASSSRRTVTKSQEKVTNLTSKVKLNTQLIGVRGGTSGKASPFGTAVGTGGPFSAGFFGSGGNARKIAYIVDASGSLIDTFPFVIIELQRSIGELSEEQAFTIIFYQGNKVIEFPPPNQLKKADTQNKQRVLQWLSEHPVTPVGQANPVPALKQALRAKPQLVFLLSDNITGEGQYEVMQKSLLDEIRKANVAGTKINTIQFLYPDPLTKFGMKGTLDLIAAESGGIFKFVDARELGIE